MNNDFLIGKYLVKDKQGEIYKMEVGYDEYAENPRNWDNVATFMSWDDRVEFDQNNRELDPVSQVLGLFNKLGDNRTVECPSWAEFHKLVDELNQRDDIVCVILELYDHSGLALGDYAYHSFPDRDWDCSRVGLAYITKETALKEFCNITEADWKQRALECIHNEIKTQSIYLEGNVLAYQLFESHHKTVEIYTCVDHGEKPVVEEKEFDDWEEIESIAGFYAESVEQLIESEGYELIKELED